MFPPSVPRFWICAAPMVAAASTSAGSVLAAQGRAADSVYVVSAPRTSTSPSRAIPRSASMPHRSTMRSGGGAELAGQTATIRSVPPAIGFTRHVRGTGRKRGICRGQIAWAETGGSIDTARRSVAPATAAERSRVSAARRPNAGDDAGRRHRRQRRRAMRLASSGLCRGRALGGPAGLPAGPTRRDAVRRVRRQ